MDMKIKSNKSLLATAADGAEDGAGLAAAAPATAAANLEAYGTGPCSCTAGHCGGGPCSGGGDDSCGRGAARMSPPVRRRLQKRSPSSLDEHPCGGASVRCDGQRYREMRWG
uniref:Uncharacterized protein n=1 Tax=Oryza rufipogon TaxID=4529 RepID=A0A0E0NIZ8_ORYRU